MRNRRLIIPSNLKIQQLINRYPVDHIVGFHPAKVYYLCHSIYHCMAKLDETTYHHNKMKWPYYVPLHSSFLKEVIGSEYKKIADWMIKVGIIYCNQYFLPGTVSKGYSFTDRYLGAGTRWVSVRFKSLVKKDAPIDGLCIESAGDSKKQYYFAPQVAKRLEKWFDHTRLCIDVTGAFEYVRQKAVKEISAANGDVDKIRMANVNANIARQTILCIDNGQYRTNQDPFGYRFHSPLTRLSRELRKFVTYDGAPLVEIDITGSQLFFSTYLLNYRHWRINGNSNKGYYLRSLWKDICIYNNANSHSTIELLKTGESRFGKGFQDHPFFRFSVSGYSSDQGGTIYEDVIEELEMHDYFPPHYTYKDKRDKVKLILLEQLFANPDNPEHAALYIGPNRLIWDCFKALYPEVVTMFDQIRNEGCKDLCKLLQRIESIAIQGYVCKWLQKHHPELPIFTLHDCLITTAGNEAIIRQAMETGIREFMGYAPKMKPKSWTGNSTGMTTSVAA